MMEPVTVESRLQQICRPVSRFSNGQNAIARKTILSPPTSTMASQTSIPLFYRLSLLYFEPFFALGGALILYIQPTVFLSTMTPSPPPTAGFLDSFRVLTDQLAAMQVLLAFNTGVLLRFAACDRDQERGRWLWRICCAGMLLCDGLHIAASVRELGWDIVLAPGDMWRVEEWVNFGILGWMAGVRLAVVLGLGMGGGEQEQISGRVVGHSSADGSKR